MIMWMTEKNWSLNYWSHSLSQGFEHGTGFLKEEIRGEMAI
jgi:hypothetical protein